MFKSMLMAAAIALTVSAPARAEKINVDTAEGYIKAMRKVQCSLKDDKPVTFWWHGQAFGRVAGMADKNLFAVDGMNTRRCVTVKDDKRGVGFKLVSRELLIYKDAKTGEILRTWQNPYTGEKVEVLHVANDPVNQNGFFGTDREGKPLKFPGTINNGQVWLNSTIPLFYQNPLAGEYQPQIGGFYHATEMFNFFADEKDLLDGKKDTAAIRVAWQRLSDWLPWMRMAGREGVIYFNTSGRALEKWDDLPEQFKKEIAANYPEYKEPPPSTDTRPNETSWTYFKKKVKPDAPAPRRFD